MLARTLYRQNTLMMLSPVTNFNFASRYQMHRITADRQIITMPKPEDLRLVIPKSGDKFL